MPADQVKGTCQCDDDDDELVAEDEARSRKRGVEYVKIREWAAPVSVQDFEAANPSRGEAPQVYTKFPELTLHQPIDQSTYRSWRWTQAHAQ